MNTEHVLLPHMRIRPKIIIQTKPKKKKHAETAKDDTFDLRWHLNKDTLNEFHECEWEFLNQVQRGIWRQAINQHFAVIFFN